MSIELRLTFVGLTALVPRKDAGSAEEATEWLVVIPSLATGETLTKGDRTFTIQPHQAVLMANALAVRDSTTKAERLRIEDPESGRSDVLFQLDHEALTIDSGTLGLQRSNGATGTVPQPHEIHDMKWVPPIRVSFDRSLLLNEQTLQPKDALASVVLLDRGTLETVDVHRQIAKPDDPVSFEFRRGDGMTVWEQALANGFRLRVPVDQDEAVLVLTDKNGDQKRLVVGAYKDPKTGEVVSIVEVQVFNRELEHILGFSALDLTEVEEDLADTDFAFFYSLSPEWDGMSADDIVLPYNTKGGGGADRKPCEPPTFTGFRA